jgi:excisionase family DNA binding protein
VAYVSDHESMLATQAETPDGAPDLGVLLTVKEVATRLNVSQKSVRRWIASDVLPAVRFAGSVRVSPEALEKFVNDELADLEHLAFIRGAVIRGLSTSRRDHLRRSYKPPKRKVKRKEQTA